MNPPHGAQFYPFYSTTVRYGSCTWQEGGKYLPGTTNDFGGSSRTEYGPLLKTVYPEAGFTTKKLINNFNSGDMPNPCRVRLGAAWSSISKWHGPRRERGTRRGPCLPGGRRPRPD